MEEYEEIFQEEFDALLAERIAKGDFTEEQLEELLDAFFYAYCSTRSSMRIAPRRISS